MSRRRRQGSDGEDDSFLYRYPLPSSSSSAIAKDNGRAAQFVRHLEYRNKSHCYECGGEGHLSYKCPRNQLGPHDRPPHSKKPRRGGGRGGGDGPSWQSDDDRWASVVDTRGEEEKAAGKTAEKAARKEKMKGYFSDEDAD